MDGLIVIIFYVRVNVIFWYFFLMIWFFLFFLFLKFDRRVLFVVV